MLQVLIQLIVQCHHHHCVLLTEGVSFFSLQPNPICPLKTWALNRHWLKWCQLWPSVSLWVLQMLWMEHHSSLFHIALTTTCGWHLLLIYPLLAAQGVRGIDSLISQSLHLCMMDNISFRTKWNHWLTVRGHKGLLHRLAELMIWQ